jgi:hypothetical protein
MTLIYEIEFSYEVQKETCCLLLLLFDCISFFSRIIAFVYISTQMHAQEED